MRKIYILILSIFLACISVPKLYSQGPGGVMPSAWYRADAPATLFSDAGVTNAADNTNVQQWNEYLGAVHNLTQASSGSQPVFSNATTLVNFNPTVTFNLDYLEYQPATGVNIIDRTQGTLYTAGYFNIVGAAGIMGFDATMDFPGLHTSNNGLNNVLFYTGGPGYQGLSSNSFSNGNYFITGANWENGAGASAVYASSIVSLNGVRSSYNDTQLQNAVINDASRDIRVGRDSNWGGMNGQVNEVIIFDNALTMAEMDRVESYLAIKYGNTYAQGGQDYLSAAGTTVWATDASYNQNIFGIARDDNSELYQKQSKSTNQKQKLIIGAGNSLFNTNAANTNTLTNGQFLMVGDNGLQQSLSVPLNYTAGTNGETNFRFESIWKVENTNGVGNVIIAWPAGIQNLYLVQSTDESFDNTDTFTPMITEVTINGVVYNTVIVNLVDGQFFTLSGFAYAPGGVADPDFWVKSDDAGNIATAWKDHSANADDIPVVGTWTLSPADRAHNFHPYTTGYTGSKYFNNATSVLNPTNGQLDNVSHSIFSAVRPTSAGTGRIVGIDDDGNGAEPGFSIEAGKLRLYKFSGGANADQFEEEPFKIGAVNVVSGIGNNPTIVGGTSTSAGGERVLGVNGIYKTYPNTTSSNRFHIQGQRLRIGDGAWTAPGPFPGDIMEVVWYKRPLTANEQTRVNTYLAIKNGATLAENYLAANSDIVWDRIVNDSYNNNIFGLARDNASALHQKQAASTDLNQQLVIGNGSSLSDTNATNSNDLNDGQFLIVGDNGLKQNLSIPFVYTSGSNGETNFRFEAVWKVQNTNSVGTVTVAWPKSINNLYLVQSADETFATGNIYTPMTTEVTINGVVYNTTTATLAGGQFFTFTGFANAPGGVLDNLGLWTKADSGFTTALWTDYSINEHHLTQATAGLQPSLEPAGNKFNFNPSVNFDSDVMENTQVASQGNNSMSLYSVASLESSASSAATLIGIGASGNNPHFGAYPTGRFMMYPSLWNNAANPTITLSSVNLMSGHWQHATAGTARIEYNGFTARSGGNESAPAGNFVVGTAAVSSTSEPWVGFVPEVIAYNQPKSGNENQRINSYLGIKYGLTLRTAGIDTGTFDYLSSASTTVWSGSVNAAYHNNVLGIARDNMSALHQKQSTSANANQQLVIGNGSSLFNTNAENTNALTEGQFLLTGDNGLKQGLTTPLSYTGGSNGETNFRFESIWKVQNTNGVGTVTIAWPVGINNLYLVQSGDEAFDNADTFTEMDNTVTINGVDYNTATVTLADGEYFTFAGYGYAPAGVVNSLSYWYRADKNAANTGDGSDVTSWTDFFSGTVSTQLGTSPLPNYVEGDASYFNFNPGVNFTATTEKIGNIDVQTLTALEFDIFTFTKEGMSGTRFFNVGRDNTTFSGTNWDGPGLYANGSIVRRNAAGGIIYGIANPGNVTFSTTIPSIMYHTFDDTSLSKGFNGGANGTTATHGAASQMVGGHIFGANSGGGTSGDDAGFVGDIGETIIYGAGTLSTEERRRVDSYLAIKYGITLSRVDTDHYLGSTASATSIIWNGADNSAYNNNIFGIARADIGGFEQKVSKSVNTGTILTVATNDDYVLGNLDASRTSFTNDEAYILFGDNEATGETSLATDPCTGETLNPAVSTTNRVWRVENTNTTDAVWLQADLNTYTFNADIEMWVADDENFTTNLVKVPAASYASGIATFNTLFPEGVKYIKFAGIVTPSQCDVCTGGTFVFKTGRSWNTLAERTNNAIDAETTGTTDQGDLIVEMDVADPANVEYGPNSTPRPYGRWMISRRYDNQNVALTHTINLNQAVAGASFQISNINTYLNNANRFTVEGFDCDGNLVLPKITETIATSTATTYEIQGNEVVGTKPYRGLASLYSTANVRFDRTIQSIVITQEVDRTNTRNTLRSLNIGDISFECAVALPPTEDNVTMIQDFTQSEDVPTCLETTMRMRFVNNNCDTRTVSISQSLPAGLEFVEDTYNDSEFTTPPAYTYNANTFTLNGLELPSGTSYLYINVRSTAGTTTTYNTSGSFTVQETGNPYNSIDPAGNADSQVSFEASNYTAPDIDLLYTVDATCLTEGDQVTYTLNFDNQEASAITGATLKVYYALGQEISSVTLNNGITGVHGFGPVGESYIEMTNVTIPTGTSSIDVMMDITSDIFTDEPTASSVFQLITEPGNACAEENPTMLSKALTLEDCSHVEVCTEEVEGESFSSNGGIPITFNQPATNYGFQFDIYSLDNSFNMEINGVQLATQEIEFQSAGTSGINVRFADGDEYETNTAAIWQMSGTASAPLIRVVIAPNGTVSMYGSKASGGELYPLELFNGNSFNSISWNDGAPNTIVATQSVISTTYINGRGSGLNEVPCPEENYCVTGDCNPNTFLNASDPNTIEYDNMVSNYHSTMMRDATTGALMVWGERMANDGNGHVLSPTEVNSTNYPALTGDILKYTSGGRNLGYGQSIILTTDGLFVWGLEGNLIHEDLTTSRTFQQVTIGTFGINGGTPKADGLPDGVSPEDVKMLFGSYRTLALTTCSGEAWVLALSTDGNKYGDEATSSAANDQLWHRVHIDATTTLDNVVAMRGNRISQMALTATGEVYTWGTNTLLGNGTGIANRLFATQMTLPAGVTPKMIGATIGGTATIGELYTTYYVLGTNGNVYAMGEGSNKQLGNFSTTSSNIWVQVQQSATPGDYLTDVTWISPNEHDGYGRYNVNSGINVLTTDGRLWAWGGNSYQMIGGGTPNYIDPTEMPGSIPQGDPYDIGKLNWIDKVIAVETGGHTSMVVKDNSKKYGYVGHRISGSMGDGDPADEQEPVYNFADTPEIDLCGAPVEAFCTQPGATGTPSEFTKVGISDRDGAVDTWPGNVPNGFMAIQSSDSGFVITRLTTTQINDLNAVEGMLVYDIDDQCIKLYNGTDWNCIARSCNE